jgi:hypothetical protein
MRQEDAEKQIAKLVERNIELEKELQQKENLYLDLYDEHNQLNDDILYLQEQLSEAGFFAEDEAEEPGKPKSSLNIPGSKKIKGILKKTLKKAKILKAKKKRPDLETSQHSAEEPGAAEEKLAPEETAASERQDSLTEEAPGIGLTTTAAQQNVALHTQKLNSLTKPGPQGGSSK